MLVFVSMCPGDLASASVLAAIARPPDYYVINAFHSFIFLQTVQEKIIDGFASKSHSSIQHNRLLCSMFKIGKKINKYVLINFNEFLQINLNQSLNSLICMRH